jgi:hypothetical protein
MCLALEGVAAPGRGARQATSIPAARTLTVCADCACISTESVCGKACLAAASCGSLLEVGLGATAAACVSSCEAEIAANAGVTTSAQCIATAACDAIPSCLVSSP